MEITATPPQGKICDGTGSQFSCFGVIYLCTKFHAFTTKCTINAAIRWTIDPTLYNLTLFCVKKLTGLLVCGGDS